MVEQRPERDPSWQAEQEVQPDPMLKERRAGPMAMILAALAAALIVTVVFYGLTNSRDDTTVAGSGSAPAVTTTGSGPATDTNAPSPADNTNTSQHGASTGSGQSSGQPQPANQGQADRAGRSGADQ